MEVIDTIHEQFNIQKGFKSRSILGGSYIFVATQ